MSIALASKETLLGTAALGVAIAFIAMLGLPFFSSHWSVQGKHIFITGGSQGLGLALAELAASKGADVTICARSVDKLQSAVEKVKNAAISPSQKIAFVSADVSSFAGAKEALAKASAGGAADGQVGRVPDAVFCCAGGAKPGFFLQQDQADFEHGFRTDYMTALSTAHSAANLFVRTGKKEAKIVFVGSTVSFIGMIGYAQYAPMKWAIRGLAESLRSEFQLYAGLQVHAYFPGTILSPGFEEENKTKPDITVQIEGPGESSGLTPAQCAKAMLRGIERGQFYTTSDFDTELMRAATASVGIVPGNNVVLDRIKGLIGTVGLWAWRSFSADPAIRAYAKKHGPRVGVAEEQ